MSELIYTVYKNNDTEEKWEKVAKIRSLYEHHNKQRVNNIDHW